MQLTKNKERMANLGFGSSIAREEKIITSKRQ